MTECGRRRERQRKWVEREAGSEVKWMWRRAAERKTRRKWRRKKKCGRERRKEVDKRATEEGAKKEEDERRWQGEAWRQQSSGVENDGDRDVNSRGRPSQPNPEQDETNDRREIANWRERQEGGNNTRDRAQKTVERYRDRESSNWEKRVRCNEHGRQSQKRRRHFKAVKRKIKQSSKKELNIGRKNWAGNKIKKEERDQIYWEWGKGGNKINQNSKITTERNRLNKTG